MALEFPVPQGQNATSIASSVEFSSTIAVKLPVEAIWGLVIT